MLSLSQVKFRYSSARSDYLIRGVSLNLTEGQIVGITGRSGCGKTTLANLICGYLTNYLGEIRIGGDLVDGPSRNAAMVFQDDGLWPWLTLQENVELALKREGSERAIKASDLLNRVDLKTSSMKYPSELSGGMKKRGEICRALALQPKILVLDEALKSLDYQTRDGVWRMLRDYLRDHPEALILNITHDLLDIAEQADRCVILSCAGNATNIDLRSEKTLDQRIFTVRNAIAEANYAGH